MDKKGKTPRVFSIEEKLQAVLSVWSERRRPMEVCRELAIKWIVLKHWQNKALEGMIKALEPQSHSREEKPPLGPGLERLLARQLGKEKKLPKRLKEIQKAT